VSLGQRVNGTRNEKDTLALEHSNSIFPPNSNLMNSSNVGYLLSNTFIKIQNKIYTFEKRLTKFYFNCGIRIPFFYF